MNCEFGKGRNGNHNRNCPVGSENPNLNGLRQHDWEISHLKRQKITPIRDKKKLPGNNR